MTSADKYASRVKENPTAGLQILGHFSKDMSECLSSKAIVTCPKSPFLPFAQNDLNANPIWLSYCLLNICINLLN